MTDNLIYNLVHHSDIILKKPVPEFDFTNPPIDPNTLSDILKTNLKHYNGIGLAANQIGLSHRAFALLIEYDNPMVFFNPKIISESPEKILLEEGCLSYPGLLVKIKRPRVIRFRAANNKGEVETFTFDGISSRCFQHECSHLDGIVHINEANSFHKTIALKRWKKLQRMRKRNVIL